MSLPDAVARLPLDGPEGLDALAKLVGNARVVAIGENAHHIREFGLLRDRILRFLVAELGFGVLAYESGFAEGQLVDSWIRGGAGELEAVARDGFTFRYGEPPEVQDMLRWLRSHNASGGHVRFAGLDVPGSGGTPVPALRHVRSYLEAEAPDEVALADAAIEATRPYAAANNGVAPGLYATLDTPTRDAAIAALTRLLLRIDALWPGSDPHQHLLARHNALGALRLDEQLRELVALGSPNPPAQVSSSRDVYQAETVRLLRSLYAPDERIVLMMHNAHTQRVPMELIPGVRARSTGTYLAADLGPDYFALGVTAVNGTTTDGRLSEQANQGFEVVARPLDPVAEGSVEEAVGDSAPVLLDLRPARGRVGRGGVGRGGVGGPTAIRYVYLHAVVDVVAAFDAVACLPEMSASSIALVEGG